MSLYYNSKNIAARISSFPGEILVKTGENVCPDTTVLRANYRIGRLCILRAAQDFDIPPEDIGKYLLKKEGDRVKWSENIAIRITLGGAKHIESPVDGVIEKIDSVLGVIVIREILERPDVPIILDIVNKFKNSTKTLKNYILVKEGDRVEYGQAVAGSKLAPYVPVYTNKVVSPCAGKIVKIDYDKGKICIQKDIPTTEMKAHYWGKISRIMPQYGVEIEFSGYVLEGAFGTGDIVWGKLVNDNTKMKANIMFLEHLSSKDISSVIEYQPAGIIAGSIDYDGIELLEKHHITSIIIEGFGRLQANKDYKNLLLQSVGRNVILKASTQVRAGVIRPEIVVPSDEEFFTYKKPKETFKIIWGQNYGKIGVMKGTPHYDETSSGIKTWLCDVLCDDNKEITSPFNNLQAIE